MIRGAEVLSPPKHRERIAVPMEILGLIYFVIVAAFGCLLVLQPATVVELQTRRLELETTLSDLKMRAEDLKKTVSAMESLDYVEFQARERLGMVEPKIVKTVTVDGGTFPRETFVQSAQDDEKGILSLLLRIAEIFETKEVTAKEKP